MSWRDPNWKYEPAATHGDSQAFAQRQRERAEASQGLREIKSIGEHMLYTQWVIDRAEQAFAEGTQ